MSPSAAVSFAVTVCWCLVEYTFYRFIQVVVRLVVSDTCWLLDVKNFKRCNVIEIGSVAMVDSICV